MSSKGSNELSNDVLKVEHLQVAFDTENGQLICVDDVSFAIPEGKNIALVGESGCGKSVTSLSIMHLLGKHGKIVGGKICFDGKDITHAAEQDMREIRGNKISMIFQEPMTSLNPVLSIRYQMEEILRLHTENTREENHRECLQLLEMVGIPNPERVLRGYPHELSGGMRQRVMIAMSLACKPKLIIADEPTTALDVTIQAQILNLIKALHEQTGTSLLLITHDMGVVAEMADEVVVMYAGQVVERAEVFTLFDNYCHPYTEGLMNSIPQMDADVNQPLIPIPGMVPSLQEMGKGCRFAPRCKYATERCTVNAPALNQVSEGHYVRCHKFTEGELRDE